MVSLSITAHIVEHRVAYLKITRKIRRTLRKSLVEHSVAERQQWKKFGQEKGGHPNFSVGKWILTRTIDNKPGPDRATTTVGEDVSLSLRAGGKVSVWSGNEEVRGFAD